MKLNKKRKNELIIQNLFISFLYLVRDFFNDLISTQYYIF